MPFSTTKSRKKGTRENDSIEAPAHAIKNPSTDGFNIVKSSFIRLLLGCEKGSDVILVDDLL